jgi:hypothetical protein
VNTKKIFIILTSFICISFFLGFLIQEDAAGGGKIDIQHIYQNIMLFKNSNLLDIKWNLYESTSLPLYYLILKYFFPFNSILAFKLFTFFISAVCLFFFYKILNIKYKNNYKEILLIATIPLLSPYFRTSAFWALEENIAYLFFLISSYFYLKNKKNIKNLILLTIFTCLTFYGRQNYAFISIIVFFGIFNFKKILSVNNFYIIFLFVIFLLPSLYFFYKWGGLVNKQNLTSDRLSFSLLNIPIILSIFFFYYIPIVLINLKSFLFKKVLKQGLIFLLIIFSFFLVLFNGIDAEILFNRNSGLGGGVIYKFIFNFGLLNNYPNFALSLLLLISSFGLLLSLYYSKKNYNFLIFFFTSIIIFSFADIIFQEYLDPLIYFFIFIYCNFIKKKDLLRSSKIFFVFYLLLLLLSLAYRY